MCQACAGVRDAVVSKAVGVPIPRGLLEPMGETGTLQEPGQSWGPEGGGSQ